MPAQRLPASRRPQTRGILTWVNQAAPGAFHPDVRYVTVAGRLIQGAPLLGPGSWQQRVVGAGYQQVGGRGDGLALVLGPVAAHLTAFMGSGRLHGVQRLQGLPACLPRGSATA